MPARRSARLQHCRPGGPFYWRLPLELIFMILDYVVTSYPPTKLIRNLALTHHCFREFLLPMLFASVTCKLSPADPFGQSFVDFFLANPHIARFVTRVNILPCHKCRLVRVNKRSIDHIVQPFENIGTLSMASLIWSTTLECPRRMHIPHTSTRMQQVIEVMTYDIMLNIGTYNAFI